MFDLIFTGVWNLPFQLISPLQGLGVVSFVYKIFSIAIKKINEYVDTLSNLQSVTSFQCFMPTAPHKMRTIQTRWRLNSPSSSSSRHSLLANSWSSVLPIRNSWDLWSKTLKVSSFFLDKLYRHWMPQLFQYYVIVFCKKLNQFWSRYF